MKEFAINFRNGNKPSISYVFTLENVNMSTYFIYFVHQKYGNQGIIANVYYWQKEGGKLQILYGEQDGRFYQNRINFVAPYSGTYEIEFTYHQDLIKSYCAGAILVKLK